ncbi:MAG TPA: antibiotic biosynthesis monooxygenase [Actinomycetes bacterium]|nr:antibiotic biosynthesis monooxygenase [Actinomycetes bacterium]
MTCVDLTGFVESAGLLCGIVSSFPLATAVRFGAGRTDLHSFRAKVRLGRSDRRASIGLTCPDNPTCGESPVIVVLFSGVDRPDMNVEEYGRASARMRELVASIPGFISFNSYTSEDGEELVVARFDSLDALEAWRTHPEHLDTQAKDRSSWSQEYWAQVSSTVREYRWTREIGYSSDLRDKFVAGSEVRPS